MLTIATRVQCWWREDFSTLPLSARMYGWGIGLLILSCVASAMKVPNWLVGPFLSTACVLLIAGFVREAYARLVKLAKQTWVRWAMVPIATMVVAVSLGGAAHVISSATGQDPSYFPLAMSFLAPLAVIPVLALVSAIALALLSLAMMFSFFVAETTAKKPEKDPMWLSFGRVMGVISTTFALTTMIDPSSLLGRSTVAIAAFSAYSLDMHTDTECGFNARDRVKRINDNLVIRMQRNGSGYPTFTRRSCALGPQ